MEELLNTLCLTWLNAEGQFLILLISGLFIGFLLSPLETFIHELGHAMAVIIIAKQIPCFSEKLTIKIKLKYNKWFNAEGTTKSNLLNYLSEKKKYYPIQIKSIAKAGFKYSSILYIFILLICLMLYIYINSLFLLGTSLNLFFLLRSELSYINGSDRKIVKNPNLFVYK